MIKCFVCLFFGFASVLCLYAFVCFFVTYDMAVYLYIPLLWYCAMVNLCTVDSLIFVGTNFRGLRKTYMFVDSYFRGFAEVCIQAYMQFVID